MWRRACLVVGVTLASASCVDDVDEPGVIGEPPGSCVADQVTSASFVLSIDRPQALRAAVAEGVASGNHVVDLHAVAGLSLGSVRTGAADTLSELDERRLEYFSQRGEELVSVMRNPPADEGDVVVLGRHNVADQVLFKGVIVAASTATYIVDLCAAEWVEVGDDWAPIVAELGESSVIEMVAAMVEDNTGALVDQFGVAFDDAGL